MMHPRFASMANFRLMISDCRLVSRLLLHFLQNSTFRVRHSAVQGCCEAALDLSFRTSSYPKLPVEGAVLDGFGDVGWFDGFFCGEVGDGAGDF